MKDNNKKIRLVLDTSVFVNPDVRAAFGSNPTEALSVFATLAEQIPTMEFYMPASIIEELMNFVSRDELPAEALLHLRQKSPEKHSLTTPAYILYELVDEMRERVNKGMRFAEKAIRSAAKDGEPDQSIRDFRGKYRDALREGILDSAEDVDLILLSMQLGAVLVSADQGAVKWADKLGVEWLIPEKFREYLDAAIARSQSAAAGA